MTSKLDQIYLDNLAVDEDDVIDIEALQEKARASVQPTLFDLGAVNSLGYGIPPVNTLMSEEDKKFATQIPQAVGKGVVMEVGGLAGDLLSIAKGLYNIPQDQMDQLMEKIKNPEAEQEVISKFDSFMRGFDDIKALNLPPLLGRTSEAIGEDLTEMGFDPKSEADSELKKKVLGAAEISGQVGTPGVGLIPLVKGGKKIVETVKKSSKTNNNMQGFSDSFSDWFDRSKVVDKDNQPLVLYHGTTKTCDKFKRPSEIKNVKRGGIVDTDGIFFSANPNTANTYARRLGFDEDFKEGAQVRPVYLNIKNPYVINDDSIPNKLQKFITEMRGNEYFGDSNKVARKDQIDKLIEQGYDGIIVKNKPKFMQENRNEYIVFNDNQVLSALSDIAEKNKGKSK